MAVHVRLRRDLASQWTSVNPVLQDGEAGYETDLRGLKIGNGTSHWVSLPYFGGGGGGSVASADFSGLSNLVSVLAQGVSVLSNEVSNLESVIGAATATSVTSDEVSAVSAQAQSAISVVNARVTSVNSQLCAISVKTAGGGSVHGQQSVVNALSDRLSAAASALGAICTKVDVLSNMRSTLAGGSVGKVLKKNSNSDYDWSWQDDLQGGGGGASGTVTSNAISAISQRLSLLSGLISTTDAHASAASAAATSADAHAGVASAAATSVDARVTSVDVRVGSVNSFLSGISARSVGNASTHGVQSVVDALSNRISQNTASIAGLSNVISALSDKVVSVSAQLVSLETHASAASAAATSVNNRLNTVSAVSGLVSVQGLQSVVNVLSNRISALVAGAGISVTSAEAQGISAEAASANLSLLSVHDVLSQKVVSISAQLVSLEGHASAASAAATSVDSRATSINTRIDSVLVFVSGISARSAGNVSTHGFQSVIDALSNRISAAESAINAISNAHSILSDKVVSVSAQLVSVETHASLASAAATSVDARVTSVNTRIDNVSAQSGITSVRGLQSVINQLSNRLSSFVAGGGISVTSTELQLASAQAASAINVVSAAHNVLSNAHSALSDKVVSISDQLTSLDIKASLISDKAASINSALQSVNTLLAGVSAKSAPGGASTHGLQSIVNALSNRISQAALTGPVNSAYVDAVSLQAASALSQALSVLSATDAGLSQKIASINVALSGLSARKGAGAGTSTHGLQSIINALSNKISAISVTGGTGSVTSTELSAVSAQAQSALSDAMSVGSVVAQNLSLRVNSVNAVIDSYSVKSAGGTSVKGLQSVLNALSNRISAISITGGSGSVTSTELSQALSVVSAQALSALSDAMSVGSVVAQNLSLRSNSINAVLAGYSVRSVGGSSVKGLQSVLDALSNRISAGGGGGSGSVTSNELSAVSAQAASALSDAISAGNNTAASINTRVDSVLTFISGISARSAGGVSTHGFQSIINALSNRISAAGGGAGSVTSNELSAASAQALSALNVLSNSHSALSDKVVSISAQLTSVDGRVNSVNTALSALSVRSVGNVSTHGLQSILNALSNRISAGGGGAGSVTSNEVSAVSAQAASALSDAISAGNNTAASLSSRVDSVFTFLSGISARSVGNVSTHGVQSVINALSGQISNQASIRAVLSDKVTSISAQLTSVDAKISTLSDKVVSISAQLVSIETHASTASAAATSVDSRVNSVNVALSALSVRSVGNVSTHGLQSVLDALSNRISATAGGAGSVTSTELSVARDGIWNLSNNDSVSLVPGHVVYNGTSTSTAKLFSTVGGFFPFGFALQTLAVSAVGAFQTQGAISLTSVQMKSIMNGVSAMTPGDRIFAAASGQWTSTANAWPIGRAVGPRTLKIAIAPIPDLQTSLNTVSNQVSINLSAVVNASTTGSLAAISLMQSAINTVSNQVSVNLSALVNASTTGSLAAISLMQSAINTVSNADSVTRSALTNASTTTSLAAISLMQSAINTVSNQVSVNQSALVNASTTGSLAAISLMQSAINTVSNQVSVNLSATNNASTAGSMAAISIALGMMQLSNNDAVSMVPGHVVYHGASASTAKLFSTVGGFFPFAVATVTLGVSAVGSFQTKGNITLTSLQMKSILNGVSAMTPGDRMFAAASGQWTSTANAWPIGYAVSTRTLNIRMNPIPDLQTSLNVVSNQVSVNLSAVVNASTTGSLAAISLMQSAINTVSNQVSVNRSAMVNASTAGSLAAISLFNAVSAKSAATSVRGLQSVIDQLSNRMSGITGGTGSVTSDEVSAVSAQAQSALSDAISAGNATASALSNRIDSVFTGLGAASTVGSIAALSLAIANDASVSAAIRADVLSVLSAGYGLGQVRYVSTGTQGVSATSFTKVSGLSISLAANAWYHVQGRVMWTTSITTGTEFGFVYPGANQVSAGSYMRMDSLVTVMAAGPTGSIYTSAIFPIGYIVAGHMSTVATTNISMTGASGAVLALNIDGMVNVTSAGVIELMMKQSATGGGVYVLPGSYLRAYKIS